MTTRKQIAFSLVLILAAIAVVWSQLRGQGEEVPGGEAGGHNHAAMGSGGEMQPVRLDAVSEERIGVTYATAEWRRLETSVEAVGTVAYDETRLATVNPKIEGWVEKLHVDFTGAPVRKGQPLMEIYSPKLVSAQEELILAARLARDAGEGRASESTGRLLESARRRLAYWDVPAEEIRRIEETGEVRKSLILEAPATGLVVEKNVVEGDRVMPGMTVYRIADLSTVWLEAEVYEKDIGLVREGQPALATFEAYPGRQFGGRVTYVYPTVSIQARTARLRLELPNPGLQLKPGMYAQIRLEGLPSDSAVVVPRSAVLATGRRNLVFARAADGVLVPRDVTPGRTVGRWVEVLDGLEAGERVVSSAAFLIDAESNLGTLGDAMTPAAEGETDHTGHDMGSGGADSVDAGGAGGADHESHGAAGSGADHSNH